VKASDEDIDCSIPASRSRRRFAAGSTGTGARGLYEGPLGAYAVIRTSRDHLVVPQNTVALADTVGAGDSFMAGSSRG